MSDTANWKPGKGWGGKHPTGFEDWSNDDYSDLADDPILAAQLGRRRRIRRPVTVIDELAALLEDTTDRTRHVWRDGQPTLWRHPPVYICKTER